MNEHIALLPCTGTVMVRDGMYRHARRQGDHGMPIGFVRRRFCSGFIAGAAGAAAAAAGRLMRFSKSCGRAVPRHWLLLCCGPWQTLRWLGARF
jgi:hypothetical protein